MFKRCITLITLTAFTIFTISCASTSQKQGGQGWEYLMKIGPGNNAILTLTDGTMRGGQIVEVHPDELLMLVAGEDMTFARSDIAVLTVKRRRNTMEGGLIGFLATGFGITAILCSGEDADCPYQAWLIAVPLLGIPGGLLGALIGSQTGGDVEIIP
ncbi:hypothetical protein JW824_02860 [bacterium]|nr:hypothetical protein [bacterium]